MSTMMKWQINISYCHTYQELKKMYVGENICRYV